MFLNKRCVRVVQKKGRIRQNYPAFSKLFFRAGRRQVPGGIAVGLLLFLGVFFSGAFAPGWANEIQKIPWGILSLPEGEHAVIVDKSRERLDLFVSKGNALVLVKEMICATGEAAGDKEIVGDKRTPDGVYFCRTILTPPNLGRKYGTCALPLNYPNPMDKLRHRNGGGIWIHGIREDRTVRSSRGCVVLENRDLIYLARHIRLFTTPVIIVERLEFDSRESLAGEADAAQAFLGKWRNALTSGDLEGFMACYAETFSPKGLSLPRWRMAQQKFFEKHGKLEIDIKNPVIIRSDTFEVISFEEKRRSGEYKEEGLRRFYVQKVSGKRKIIREEWLPSVVVEKRQKAYAETLSRLSPPERAYRIFYPLPPEGSVTDGRGMLYKEIRGFLEAWKEAWEKKDLAHYISFYSTHFRQDSMNLETWRRYKSRVFIEEGPIQLEIQDIMVHVKGDHISVRFLQDYRKGTFEDRGIKVLELCREAGALKILRETWSRER